MIAACSLISGCSRSVLVGEPVVGVQSDGGVTIVLPDPNDASEDAAATVDADGAISHVDASVIGVDASAADMAVPLTPDAGPSCIGTVWSVAQGGNGHCYRVVSVPTLITWDGASGAAQAAGGHLATISSAAENAFVFALSLTDPGVWVADSVGGIQGPWLGGRRVGSTWTWVTGEAWAYADWAAGEPSGTYNGTVEDRLQMRGEDGTMRPRETWNDEGNGGFEGLPTSYVIEFEP